MKDQEVFYSLASAMAKMVDAARCFDESAAHRAAALSKSIVKDAPGSCGVL